MKAAHAPPHAGRMAILENPKVRLWHDKLALRTNVTANEYARKLSFVLEAIGLDPETVVNEARKSDEFSARLVRYAAEAKKRGLLDNYISKSLNGLRSYLKFRRTAFDGWPVLSPVRGASLEKERVPQPDELGRVLEHLSLRGRVVALLMAHSGVRPAVLGSYGGAGGLTLGDLPEFDLKTLTFAEKPFIVRVPAPLSKTKAAYTTFGSDQLGRSLAAYISDRRGDGESLSSRSPVIGHARMVRGVARVAAESTGSRFLSTKAITEEIRFALDAVVPQDVTWRPYVLRAYCSTRLLMAEGEGKITRDLREAILGHETGVSGRYSVGKRWGDDLMREGRAAYKRSESFLSTTGGPSRTQDEIQREAAVLLLMGMKGRTEEDARRMTEGKSSAELANLIKPTAASEKAVPADAAQRFLDAGWTFVGSLKNGELAVIKSPGTLSSATTPGGRLAAPDAIVAH